MMMRMSLQKWPLPARNPCGQRGHPAPPAGCSKLRPLVPNLPTPVLPHQLATYLRGYARRERNHLIRGFSVGFRIPSTITCDTHVPGHVNHLSAIDHHHFVTTKFAQEVAAGRIAGPFTHPSPVGVVLSPLGVVPKKVSGQFRLIHDISFPKDNSVNSHIAKLHSKVHYELLDDCVSIIREIGQGCLVA